MLAAAFAVCKPTQGLSRACWHVQEVHERVYNFSAGPAVLPVPVLEQAQADLLNWQGSGMSVMEMSHRGPEFTRIIEEAEADLRALLGIPGNYKVLFLQGGATQQFAAIPLNLTQPGDVVDQVALSPSFSAPVAFLCYARWMACVKRVLGRPALLHVERCT